MLAITYHCELTEKNDERWVVLIGQVIRDKQEMTPG